MTLPTATSPEPSRRRRRVRELGVESLAVQADISREDDVEAVRDATIVHFGRCDLLVNNATMSYLAPFLELSVKRWDIIMGVNLRGPMLLSRAFLPGMLERGEGHIVNISSADARLDLDETAAPADAVGSRGGEASFGDAGQSLGPSTTAYGTSKAALNRMTVGLARELRGTGVAVNGLEVSAVTDAVRLNLPHADFSLNELPEAPAQLIAWIATQGPEFTENILWQNDLLARLRKEGLIRAKVDPA
jgi:citronellol/citronellal dehydrogenase